MRQFYGTSLMSLTKKTLRHAPEIALSSISLNELDVLLRSTFHRTFIL